MSSKKPTCFVIQEFDDGGTFDQRYKDIIEPALESLNVEPLRANEVNPAPKVSLSASTGNKVDQLKKHLKVMCWETNRWNIYPLSKFDISSDNESLVIINKTYIHRFAKLIYDKKLVGNFKSIISLEGNWRSIGLFTADGKDRDIYVNPSDQSIDVTNKYSIEILRTDSNIKFQTGEGERLYYNKYHAQEDMEFCTGISLINDAKVKIYSWEVEAL